ncbi:type II secretion system protein [Virgibacillus senegalensis]|uniref:type II secretion system protein n=1 Tax=Virgibacillus senegalensis TaxID=1499679 RepID=UPI0006A0002C|nr:type II secretion system protein [Virgibacillus senegalensis]
MRNCKGFSTLEAMAAFSIFLMVSVTILPSIYFIKIEDHTLTLKRQVLSQLHEDLLEMSYGDQLENPEQKNYHVIIKGRKIDFHFVKETNLIEGCAKWKNAKKEIDEVCLYGYPAKK